MRARTAIAAFALASLVASRAARAETVEDCLSAAEQGEPLQKQARLVQAREKYALCAVASCPAAVRNVCRQHLDEVDKALPTIVVRVTTEDAREVPDARLTVDGEAAAPGPGGELAVDPGPRTVRASANGQSAERLVEVSLGQKRIPVVLTLSRPSTPAKPAPRPVEPTRSEGRSPTAAYGLGAIGLAALATGTVFGIKWISDSSCAPACTRDETRRIETGAILTDVFLGTGVIALGVATYLYLTSRQAR